VAVADTIVKAAVQDELSEMNVSSDFYDALDENVRELLADGSGQFTDPGRLSRGGG
jgi:hypothetical protein